MEKIYKLEIENKDKGKNSNENKPKVFDKVKCAPIAKNHGTKILNVNIRKHLGIPHSNVLDVAESGTNSTTAE